MQVMINTPGSYVEKWSENEPGVEFSKAEALGFVLAAALYAVGPTRLDEVVGHCITALADHNAFGCSRVRPASEAIDDLCDAARRIVAAWKKHDQRFSAT